MHTELLNGCKIYKQYCGCGNRPVLSFSGAVICSIQADPRKFLPENDIRLNKLCLAL